jgi:hypothetical protein
MTHVSAEATLTVFRNRAYNPAPFRNPQAARLTLQRPISKGDKGFHQ